MRDRVEDGGPAFAHGSPEHGGHPGMSLRDWFAGQAMAGFYAGYRDTSQLSTFPSDLKTDAETFYEIADAMLAARKGGDA